MCAVVPTIDYCTESNVESNYTTNCIKWDYEHSCSSKPMSFLNLIVGLVEVNQILLNEWMKQSIYFTL